MENRERFCPVLFEKLGNAFCVAEREGYLRSRGLPPFTSPCSPFVSLGWIKGGCRKQSPTDLNLCPFCSRRE